MNSKQYTAQLKQRIDSMPDGTPFIAKDFADITDAQTIRRLINLMIDQGEISRIIPGVYYRPRVSSVLGVPVPPQADAVARAIARSNGWIIAPGGETALNQLGLSTQVPAAWTYLSDGPYREYSYGNTRLKFKKTTGRNLKGMALTSTMVVQALKALGRERVTQEVIRQIARRLNEAQKQELTQQTMMATEWIRDAVTSICAEGDE